MPERPKQRILSMDGGPGLVVYLRLLRELIRVRPDFFDQVDMYAGTSAGSISSLLFATYPKGTPGQQIIDRAIEIADQLLWIAKPGLAGLLRFASGFRSIDSTRSLRELLETCLYIDGKPTTLGDLKRHVTIVSFMLRDPWSPKVYHNYNDDDDCAVDAVEVAMCSSAFPIYYPIYTGHVDGGVFANNPGMCAIAQLLHQSHFQPLTCDIEEHADPFGLEDDSEAHKCELNDLVMLSLGGEDRRFGGTIDQRLLDKDRVHWGWLQWLLQFPRILLLLDLLINADGKGVSYQCGQLLQQQFKRLALTTKGGNIGSFMELFFGRGEAFIRQAERLAQEWRDNPDSDSFSPNFNDMLRWLDANWYDPVATATTPLPNTRQPPAVQ